VDSRFCAIFEHKFLLFIAGSKVVSTESSVDTLPLASSD
jgi:hypothetical protein